MTCCWSSSMATFSSNSYLHSAGCSVCSRMSYLSSLGSLLLSAVRSLCLLALLYLIIRTMIPVCMADIRLARRRLQPGPVPNRPSTLTRFTEVERKIQRLEAAYSTTRNAQTDAETKIRQLEAADASTREALFHRDADMRSMRRGMQRLEHAGRDQHAQLVVEHQASVEHYRYFYEKLGRFDVEIYNFQKDVSRDIEQLRRPRDLAPAQNSSRRRGSDTSDSSSETRSS